MHLRNERFSSQRKSKLEPRGDRPFQLVEKINDNAYKLDLPGEYNVSATFSVSDLNPFDVGESNSRSNPFEERGNDGDSVAPSSPQLIQVPESVITRSRAKKLRDELNYFCKGFMEGQAKYIQEELKLFNSVGWNDEDPSGYIISDGPREHCKVKAGLKPPA